MKARAKYHKVEYVKLVWSDGFIYELTRDNEEITLGMVRDQIMEISYRGRNVREGDYLIYADGRLIDIISPETFERYYEA